MKIKLNIPKSKVKEIIYNSKNIIKCRLIDDSMCWHADTTLYAYITYSEFGMILCTDKLILDEEITWGRHENYNCFWVAKGCLGGLSEKLKERGTK